MVLSNIHYRHETTNNKKMGKNPQYQLNIHKMIQIQICYDKKFEKKYVYNSLKWL